LRYNLTLTLPCPRTRSSRPSSFQSTIFGDELPPGVISFPFAFRFPSKCNMPEDFRLKNSICPLPASPTIRSFIPSPLKSST